jgi:peptidoglycan/LPS O-acetylase OafA/YrhL
LTVTATILALCWIFPQSSKLPALALDKFLYIAANLAMLPGILNIDPLTAPAWSLSYEMLFYFSLPLIIAGLGMRRWAWWHRIVFFLSLSAVHAFLCAVGVDGHVRFIMFTGGMVLCEIARNCNPAAKLNSWGERAAIAAFLANLAAIGIAFSDVVPTDLAWVLYSLSLLVTVFFLILHAVFFDGILRKFFSFDYLRWLGNMSYSYYLSHGITVHGIQMVMDSRFAGLPRTVFWFVIAFVVCVIGSVVVGALLFLGVEKPLSLTPRAKTVRQPIAPPVPVE